MSTKAKYPGMPPAHPIAELFPLHEGAPLFKLTERIKANGLLEPIVMLDGMILDGRRRWRACINAGVEPRTVEFRDRPEAGSVSPLDWVWDINFHRRQLGYGEQELAAARYKIHLRDNPQDGIRLGDVAHKLGVSESTVRRAEKVITKGEPEVVAAVESGKVTIKEAAKLVDESPKVQRESIKDVVDRVAKNVAAAAAKRKPPNTNGKPVFDDKIITENFGRMYRAITDRWRLQGQDAGDKKFLAVKESCNAILKRLEEWGVEV